MSVNGRVNCVGGRWLWRCTNCGKVAPWSDSWSWYGSYRAADENEFDWVSCSPGCNSPSDAAKQRTRAVFDAHRRALSREAAP